MISLFDIRMKLRSVQRQGKTNPCIQGQQSAQAPNPGKIRMKTGALSIPNRRVQGHPQLPAGRFCGPDRSVSRGQ